MLNSVVLSGYVGKFIDIKYMAKGGKYATFTVAQKEKDGSYSNYRCVVFYEKLVDYVQSYVKHGNFVEVEGSIRLEKWKDKNGFDQKDVSITVNRIPVRLDGYAKEGPAPVQKQEVDSLGPVNEPKVEISSDDLPF